MMTDRRRLTVVASVILALSFGLYLVLDLRLTGAHAQDVRIKERLSFSAIRTHNPDWSLSRAKVPGGWLVLGSSGERGQGLAFVPDHDHLWDGADSSESPEKKKLFEGKAVVIQPKVGLLFAVCELGVEKIAGKQFFVYEGRLADGGYRSAIAADEVSRLKSFETLEMASEYVESKQPRADRTTPTSDK